MPGLASSPSPSFLGIAVEEYVFARQRCSMAMRDSLETRPLQPWSALVEKSAEGKDLRRPVVGGSQCTQVTFLAAETRARQPPEHWDPDPTKLDLYSSSALQSVADLGEMPKITAPGH